ncbi:hypothetical protein OAA10_00240, partial [bacterium]|nr:hypothetical protein [bacterium]
IVERRITTEHYWRNGVRKGRTKTLPAVTAVQAQRQLDQILPMIDQLLSDASPAYTNDLREAFLSSTFESFSAELLRHLAEDRGQQKTFDITSADSLPQLPERTKEETDLLMARLNGTAVT